MVIENEFILNWCKSIMIALKGKIYERKYYHTLDCTDAAPLVVHAKTAQISVVIKGHGFVAVDGVVTEIQEGSVSLINAGIQHKFWTDEGNIVLFHIHVPYETMNSDRKIVYGQDFEVH